jgi:hypothetical protein
MRLAPLALALPALVRGQCGLSDADAFMGFPCPNWNGFCTLDVMNNNFAPPDPSVFPFVSAYSNYHMTKLYQACPQTCMGEACASPCEDNAAYVLAAYNLACDSLAGLCTNAALTDDQKEEVRTHCPATCAPEYEAECNSISDDDNDPANTMAYFQCAAHKGICIKSPSAPPAPPTPPSPPPTPPMTPPAAPDSWQCTTLPELVFSGSSSSGVKCDPSHGIENEICTICPIGHVSQGGANAKCSLCPKGKAAPTPGMSTCLIAEAGTEYLTNSSSTPTPCEPGYRSDTGTPCELCKTGKWAVDAGTSTCSQCPKYGYIPLTAEQQNGDYDTAEDLAPQCQTCAAGSSPGKYKADGVAKSFIDTKGGPGVTCKLCNSEAPFGWRVDNGGVEPYGCQYCAAGKFLASADYDPAVSQAESCTDDCSVVPNAPPGASMSTVYNECQNPVASMVGIGMGKCEIGYVPSKVSEAGSGEEPGCEMCPANTFALPGWEECIPCKGAYHSAPGSGGCVPTEPKPTCASGEVMIPQPENYDYIISVIFQTFGLKGCDGLFAAAGGPFTAQYGALCRKTMKEKGLTYKATGVEFGMDDNYALGYLIGTVGADSANPGVDCPNYIAEQSTCSQKWLEGYQTSKYGNDYDVPSQPAGPGWWPGKVLATVGTGLVTRDELLSGGGVEHIFNRFAEIRGNTPCIWHKPCPEDDPSACPDGGKAAFEFLGGRKCLMRTDPSEKTLPMTCVEASPLCGSPLIAIICPQTCGVIPNSQIMDGEPWAEVTTGGQWRISWPFWSVPVRPPSMHDCPDERFHGKWNMETGMLEPFCEPPAPEPKSCTEGASCSYDSDCGERGRCVAGRHRRLMFAAVPHQCVC